ncbi:hypothetical protein M407DRAFT_83748 [Tulasnella calospora MUT 4182]|uniref:CxC2-like cysteine cluster KDZ transposase-associated domain-containing protein n=1 Tax=Tulasnella calospora MUT 4182 TaxID=1051891 RepID=A0A0C3PUR2_9AGAM|nr:hypothetical protein M407DRAFT_83748 [Tulasnella calospora MUT 4182]
MCRAAARIHEEAAAASPGEIPVDTKAPNPPNFTLQKPEYRCLDCIGAWRYCEECVVADHCGTPLHRIERWNGLMFSLSWRVSSLRHMRDQATAFTFQLLKHYHQSNLASKTAAHDYHKCLLRLSDPIQPHKIPSAYHQFVDMMRQWRALQTFQSSGKLDSSEVRRGELAYTCPACPHPGINIPSGWEDHPNQ